MGMIETTNTMFLSLIFAKQSYNEPFWLKTYTVSTDIGQQLLKMK